MRGWYVAIILVLLCAVAVNADQLNESLCSDSDNGGERSSDDAALKTAGDVTYGITTQSDTCLSSENGVSISEGHWLKEYFCQNDQRNSEAYDCIKLGYEKCQDGACIGTVSASQQQQQQLPEKHCGNKILEKDLGEQCDPPNGICFGKTTAQYGICLSDCTCKISAAAEAPPAVCGDSYLDTGEECEEDDDCAADHVCSSCKCVKQLTAEEIEALKQSAKAGNEEKTQVSGEIEEKYKTPVPVEVNVTGKNFSEDPGIKVATGIGGFFKRIFSWIGALFA